MTEFSQSKYLAEGRNNPVAKHAGKRRDDKGHLLLGWR